MAKEKFQPNFMMNQTETVKRYIHSYIPFAICYLAAPQRTLGPHLGDSLTQLMLISVFHQLRPEGHQ